MLRILTALAAATMLSACPHRTVIDSAALLEMARLDAERDAISVQLHRRAAACLASPVSECPTCAELAAQAERIDHSRAWEFRAVEAHVDPSVDLPPAPGLFDAEAAAAAFCDAQED